MTYIDSVILNLTEWSCRKFQLLTGKTNVWLAIQLTNLSIIVYFVWAGLYFVAVDVVSRVLVAVFCSGLLYVLTQTIFKVPIEAYEADAYRRVAKGLRNPRRVRDALLRISFLTLLLLLGYPVIFVYLTIGQPIILLGYTLIVLTTVLLYVLACDPLPPCPSKVTEWLRGAAPSPAPVPESPDRANVVGAAAHQRDPRRVRAARGRADRTRRSGARRRLPAGASRRSASR
jgi:hypothetical protein